jgi:hypothetical protein
MHCIVVLAYYSLSIKYLISRILHVKIGGDGVVLWNLRKKENHCFYTDAQAQFYFIFEYLKKRNKHSSFPGVTEIITHRTS